MSANLNSLLTQGQVAGSTSPGGFPPSSPSSGFNMSDQSAQPSAQSLVRQIGDDFSSVAQMMSSLTQKYPMAETNLKAATQALASAQMDAVTAVSSSGASPTSPPVTSG